MIKFDKCFNSLPLNFNPDEVEEAAWVSLPQLKETLSNKTYMDVPGYRITKNSHFFMKPNTLINTNALYPLYRYNPMRQGLGKGHYLALKYLLLKRLF